MDETLYSKAGFKAWALATFWSTLPWILYWSWVVAADMRGPYGMSLQEALWFLTIAAIPVLLSGLLNWMYERTYTDEVLHSWYRHPENAIERIMCVVGGAICVIATPFIGIIVWGVMIFWVLKKP